jgi:hypothetical protein
MKARTDFRMLIAEFERIFRIAFEIHFKGIIVEACDGEDLATDFVHKCIGAEGKSLFGIGF